MIYPSRIELSKSALRKNINYLKRRIGKKVKFVSVIKGNAYGHGIESYLPLAENCGVDYFAVSDTPEAARAMAVKHPSSHIMIMNMIDNGDIDWAVENEVSYFVFNLERIEKSIEASKKVGKKALVHIEIETGFNRTGLNNSELTEFIEIYKRNSEYLEIEGICTHLAGAESVANYLRIQNQLVKYNQTLHILHDNGVKSKYRHVASSAAALTYAETRMNMVRFGIAQFGFWPSKETRMYNMLSDDAHFTKDPLHRILSWKTTVTSIKHIPAGEFVGYGTSYLTTEPTVAAVIPIGYCHGFSRNLSNLGYVLIKKKKAQVIGMVNMNMLMVNVTHIHGVNRGEDVVLIGRQGRHEITVSSFSDLANYVNYELLVRLSYEIPRIVVD